MEQARIIIGIIISSIIALFTPIKDVMLAMLVLFSINGAMGLLEDILHGSWRRSRAASAGRSWWAVSKAWPSGATANICTRS